MADARCACGFTEADGVDETINDHLLEMFAPPDGRGNDGALHEEIMPDLTCSCGFQASATGELDSHFLEMFVPADGVDVGGVEHKGIDVAQ